MTDFLQQFTDQFNKLKQAVDARNKNYYDFINYLIPRVGGLATALKQLDDKLPSYLSAFSNEIIKNKQKISELEKQLSDNQGGMEKYTEELNSLTEEVESLTADKQKVEQELETLKEELENVKTSMQSEIDGNKTKYDQEKQLLESQIKDKQDELDSIKNSSGDVQSEILKLNEEKEVLKKENDKYITSITNATAAIGDLINKLTINQREDKDGKRLEPTLNNIENYISEISNKLQGYNLQDQGNGGKEQNNTTGGKRRRRQKRKTQKIRKVKKQSGGYLASAKHRKYSSRSKSRKTSYSKKSTSKGGKLRHF